jgi:hypothetical protein
MRPLIYLALTVCLGMANLAQASGKAHEHGALKLGIAVEPGKITVEMEAPLDNLLGYERAPRTDAERKLADAAVATLKAAEPLFKMDPAAQCKLARVELNSAALKLGQAEPGTADSGHTDIDGSFEFACGDALKAGFMDVTLFDSFPRMKRIDVQVATPKGQLKRTLRRPAQRVPLTRP